MVLDNRLAAKCLIAASIVLEMQQTKKRESNTQLKRWSAKQNKLIKIKRKTKTCLKLLSQTHIKFIF